jgi:cellulose synthase/poly-beta-1,6-N-acetylglucosamine synthase-like glycosyltransferase
VREAALSREFKLQLKSPAKPEQRDVPMTSPLVSVIIPCREERTHIASCIASILAGDYPRDRLEIVIADGMSRDGTREILDEFRAKYSNVRVIDNPGKGIASGLNLAIRAAAGDIILRMDAHTEYAPEYVRHCVDELEKGHADNVGGPARTKATGYIQQANRIAYHSRFSVGGARFHDPDYEGYVDTVPYGCWYKKRLIEVGLFDEEFGRNEDDELNLRIIRLGGKIWQSARIKSWYYPRASLASLFRQYSQYGYWKVRVIQKHKMPASWRHLVPAAWLASLAGLLLTAPFSILARWLLLVHVSLYGLGLLGATLAACRQPRTLKFIPVLPFVFTTYHAAYGYGFLRGVIDFWLLRRGARRSFDTLTRDNFTTGETR